MKPELEVYPIGPDMSLYSLVSLYLDAGTEIDTLLSSRADTELQEEQDRTKNVRILRLKAIGLLNQFRGALVHEVSTNQNLPRDLEETVFAYYDELREIKKGRGQKSDSSDTPEQPAPAAPA